MNETKKGTSNIGARNSGKAIANRWRELNKKGEFARLYIKDFLSGGRRESIVEIIKEGATPLQVLMVCRGLGYFEDTNENDFIKVFKEVFKKEMEESAPARIKEIESREDDNEEADNDKRKGDDISEKKTEEPSPFLEIVTNKTNEQIGRAHV